MELEVIPARIENRGGLKEDLNIIVYLVRVSNVYICTYSFFTQNLTYGTQAILAYNKIERLQQI